MSIERLIVILGPTSSGKSDLAVKLAKKYKGEIISADSRQVYKGLNLGSGKITKTEMRGIPHHLLDIASPKRTYTVADYKKDAERTLKNILTKGKVPVITGGTGFYIDALLYDLSFPEVKPNLKLRAKLEKISAPKLFLELLRKDRERAKDIDPHNKRRLIRALEIIEATGKPIQKIGLKEVSSLLKAYGIESKDILKIGIKRSDNELKERIHERIIVRLKKGMVGEVRHLHDKGLSWKRMDDLGLEYRYISRYLRGLMTREKMIEELEKETWQYVRRQMTWWRKDKEIKWIDPKEINLQLISVELSL